MKRFLLLSVVLSLINVKPNAQAVSPYTTCPNADVAVVRSGSDNDFTNPYFLYNVNTATGAMTQVTGGPFKDPADASKNLQVNGIGLSKKDGFMYGLAMNEGNRSARFVRLDKNYGVTNLGTINAPTAEGRIGYINPMAGETDTAGNYYFMAFTVSDLSSQIRELYLGVISNTQSLSGGTPTVTYYEISESGAECTNLVASLISNTPGSLMIDFDFSYDALTNSFFSYVTYENSGSGSFSGQLFELRTLAGVSPTRYGIFCNSTVNTHSSRAVGTSINKNGNLTVLFSDGSVGQASKSATGGYTGGLTIINSSTGLPNPLRGDMGSCGQNTAMNPFTTCPQVNVVLARQGSTEDVTNPYYLLTLNTTNGSVAALPGGPLTYPTDKSRNIQINGFGVNMTDGLMYGLEQENARANVRLVRFDQNYRVELLGTIAPPATTSPDQVAVVNQAAGDVDGFDNYFFTAAIAKPGTTPGTFVIEKIYLGKIANVSAVTGTVTPEYYEIKTTDADCSAYMNSLINDPDNSSFKDFSYNPFTNSFFTYVTYKPAGATNFSGQVVEIKPVMSGTTITGYQLNCKSVVNTHTAEVSGVTIDHNGRFLVLMTDGSIGRIESTGTSTNYTGVFTVLNDATGLPTTLTGDLGSCHEDEDPIIVPVRLTSFNAVAKDCQNVFTWTTEDAINFSHFEMEQSVDGVNYVKVATVNSSSSIASKSYQLTLPSPGKGAAYRLKMVDTDGSYTYSKNVTVSNACNQNQFGFIIARNPVASQLTLNWYGIKKSTPVEVVIYNAHGSAVVRTAKTLPVSNSTLSLNVDQLPAGVYFIKAIDSKTGNSFEARFVKQ